MAVVIFFEIKPKIDPKDFENAASQSIAVTRDFEGCNYAHVYQDINEPTIYRLVMEWETIEHFQKYHAFRVEEGGGTPNLSKIADVTSSFNTKREDV